MPIAQQTQVYGAMFVNKVLRALGTISVEGLGDLLSESMFLYRILLQVTPLQ